MSILCKYVQGDKARFDFRICDGLGNYVEPDWDDPDLRVEFYDSAHNLKFTATRSSSPPLALAEDGKGKFLYAEGIDLGDFALGVCSANISCTVLGAGVLPYPTVMEAFLVVTGTGAEPEYTTVTQVRNELPLAIPGQLTDSLVEQFIYDASRRIDAALYDYYSVPFPGIEQNPRTPALIERLARKLAVAECLVFLGMLNQTELKSTIEEQALSELLRIQKGELCLPGHNPPLAVYQGGIYQEESEPGDILD